MTKPKLRMMDIRLLDDVFAMGSGYVLDFSNSTFATFFKEELDVDIDNPKYAVEGTSKAKRLRYFLRVSPPEVSAKTISALWDYRERTRRRSGADEQFPAAANEVEALVCRLSVDQKTAAQGPAGDQSTEILPAADAMLRLQSELIALSDLDPQPRGYAFEKFLLGLFNAYGLGGRASFRLEGEQIDGSFELGNETYLLEAKWTNLPVDAAGLRAFNAKVEAKAAWTRGLYVSQSGFSRAGLNAFGSGGSIICMEGLDLYEILNRKLSFTAVLARKVRRAAETGRPFVSFRDLGL